MSREHYFSKAALQHLQEIRVSGLKYGDGRRITVTAKSVTAKMLCTQHNSMMSDLDAEFARLFGHVRAVFDRDGERYPRADGPRRGLALFSGPMLERWMLKYILGIVAGGAMVLKLPRPKGWAPSREKCQLLFGGMTWPAESGLFALRGGEHGGFAIGSTSLDLYFDEFDLSPVGAQIHVGPFRFLLTLEPYHAGFDLGHGVAPHLRPSEIQVRHGDNLHRLAFGWPDDEPTSGPISFVLDPEGNVPPVPGMAWRILGPRGWIESFRRA